MIKLPVKLKRFIVSSTLLICSVLLTNVSAQNINFTCKLDSSLINNQYRYSIIVDLTNNSSPSTVSLFEYNLNKGYSLLQKKEDLTALSYTFFTNDRRKWMVMVERGDQNNSKIIK